MNPTFGLFIKLSILISLSLQVCTSESFSYSQTLGPLQDELQALQISRKQLGRRQAGAATPNATFNDIAKKEKGSKEEEMANQLIVAIAQMGNSLETLTSLASNTGEILEHSKKAQELVPQLNSLSKNLIATVPAKTDELNRSLDSASAAGEALTKSLKEIDQKPDDANLIKSNFKNLEKSFQAMLSASDNMAIAAVPKLAELLRNEQQKEENQQGQA